MSGRIGKYTYKNESVLKEFLGSLFMLAILWRRFGGPIPAYQK